MKGIHSMKINLIWEHKGDSSLLYCEKYPGAFTRGENLKDALSKMPAELSSFLAWWGQKTPDAVELNIVQDVPSELNIADADSDVLFDAEREPLSAGEYAELKALVLRSAADFQRLYDSVPAPDKSVLPARNTFYGSAPRTAREMYEHTKSVNSYYFAEIDVEADNSGSIYDCRLRGFEKLEEQPDFLTRPAVEGSYGEWWSLRKLLRRFIWHDRIHARAMCRMAKKTFGNAKTIDPFKFGIQL